MTAYILDAGALVAVDRGDRRLVTRLRAATLDGVVLRTNPLAIAQAWRHGDGRQARLALLLRGADVVPVGEQHGRAIGELLGSTGTRDIVDASLVLLAQPGDVVVTSDVDDLQPLAEARGSRVTFLAC